LTTALKEDVREIDHGRDGKIHSTNPEIGTGQKSKPCSDNDDYDNAFQMFV
jgi:hypothetical protein